MFKAYQAGYLQQFLFQTKLTKIALVSKYSAEDVLFNTGQVALGFL